MSCGIAAAVVDSNPIVDGREPRRCGIIDDAFASLAAILYFNFTIDAGQSAQRYGEHK
jgi:hypothetical protein